MDVDMKNPVKMMHLLVDRSVYVTGRFLPVDTRTHILLTGILLFFGHVDKCVWPFDILIWHFEVACILLMD
jgi:hypothetical protein